MLARKKLPRPLQLDAPLLLLGRCANAVFRILALAALGEEAGLPPGSFSVLTGNPAVLGGELCRNEVVRGISFTGSTEVGQPSMAQCAPSLIRRLSLELADMRPSSCLQISMSNLRQKRRRRLNINGGIGSPGGELHIRSSPKFIPIFSTPSYGGETYPRWRRFRTGCRDGTADQSKTLAKSETHVADAVSKSARLLTGGRRSCKANCFTQPTGTC